MLSPLELQLAAQIAQAGLPEPVREYQFHAERRWRFDFAWPDRHIAAEVEGGAWTRGRHTRGQGFVDDCEKYNEAARAGWIVFRFPVDHIQNGYALDVLREMLQ